MSKLITLFTDFGTLGPYQGQLQLVFADQAPGATVVDLLSTAPMGNPRAAAYLLNALSSYIPEGGIVLAVVDPGVGGARDGLIIDNGYHLYVGPDNGLLALVARSGLKTECRRIDWRPDALSASFHGRDLFAPVAARLSRGKDVASSPLRIDQIQGADWPEDLAEVIFIDDFGNLFTGIRASQIDPSSTLELGSQLVFHARTFSDVAVGEAFWYANSYGLVEIAVNQGSAVMQLGLRIGDTITVRP